MCSTYISRNHKMGLLYLLPISLDEFQHAKEKDGGILLKTYGLPLIFWFYLLCIWLVVGIMALVVYRPLELLYQTNEQLNQIISIGAYATLSLIPLLFTLAFFYQHRALNRQHELVISHRLRRPSIW